MQVIISGSNRMEICKVTKKHDFDRRFFMTRGQLYFVPTNALVRMRVYEYGREKPSEAAICYVENETVPYDPCDIIWSMDNMLADIDRYKQMTNYSWFNKKKDKPWFVNKAQWAWHQIIAGPGLVAIVLVYLFVTGGIKV